MPNALQRIGRVFGFGGAAKPPRAAPFRDMGVSGTSVTGGRPVTREKSAKWSGQQRYVTIADMAVNTSIIAAGMHYFLNLIAHPAWSVAPAEVEGREDEAVEFAEFVEACLHDMDEPWSRIVRRAGTYRFYGFGVHEWRAKRRDDGRVGLASIHPRPQHTIERWAIADDGSIEGVWQRPINSGDLLGIPRSKILYLVDDVLTDSPEGVGIFRHLAEPWERLTHYFELEARAYERDLRGIPVGRVPYALINDMVASGDLSEADARALTDGVESFVKLAIKESNTGITLDSARYESQAADGRKVTGEPLWDVSLLQGSASGVAELGAAIVRTQFEMARILTAEHLLMGETSGNRSLGEDKSRNLSLIGDAVLGDIAAGVRQDVIPALGLLNGVDEALWPTLHPETVSFKDAELIAKTLQSMATAGAVLGPDDPVITDVRELMGVSPPPAVTPELAGMEEEEPEGAPVVDDEEAAEDVIEEDEEEDDVGEKRVAYAKGEKTLYVSRPLLNGDEVRAWAAANGMETTLPADDMHVTIAFSRTPVEWSVLRPQGFNVVIPAGVGARQLHQFPAQAAANGAVVLKFAAPFLEQRHRALRDAGASWDHESYQPHVTLTYAVPRLRALGDVQPYAGRLVFGPEKFAEVNADWASGVVETTTVKRVRSTKRQRVRSARA